MKGKPAMRRLLSPLAAIFSELGARELMLFAGLGLLGYGLSLVYWPAAFIAPGAVLAAVAVFGTR